MGKTDSVSRPIFRESAPGASRYRGNHEGHDDESKIRLRTGEAKAYEGADEGQQ